MTEAEKGSMLQLSATWVSQSLADSRKALKQLQFACFLMIYVVLKYKLLLVSGEREVG